MTVNDRVPGGGVSRRLAPLNQLAAGVADEMGNLLTPILGYSELLLSTLDPSGKARAQAGEIHRAAERFRELVESLRAMGRTRVLSLGPADLAGIGRAMEPAVRAELPGQIGLRVAWSPGPIPIRADRGRVEQAIESLVANACAAMPRGGFLSLEARTAAAEESARARMAGLVGDGVALFRVGDTGPCLDAGERVALSDPSFIGERGLEAGLRLASVRGIVRQHGGALLVDSGPDIGTIVSLCFPEVIPA
jgi:two-component system, cell cycle sensor histidine kinase and response regulator CckA